MSAQEAPMLTPKPTRLIRAADLNATTPPPSPSWFLPLSKLDEAGVRSWYDSNNWIAPLSQVRFLYGFGQDTKSLSADLVTMTFKPGFLVALGTSVSSSSSGSAVSTDQAIERLKAGGDFYVRSLYPIIASPRDNKKHFLTLMFAPRLGFNFSGFANGATITEATEYNGNFSFELYGQQMAIPDKDGHAVGFVYGDVRSGIQGVQKDFAQKVGLGGKTWFPLTQMDAGFQFGGFLRIGFQKYFGPEQAFGVSRDEFRKFHLVLQLTPLKL
jgi:hypothetical protein